MLITTSLLEKAYLVVDFTVDLIAQHLTKGCESWTVLTLHIFWQIPRSNWEELLLALQKYYFLESLPNILFCGDFQSSYIHISLFFSASCFSMSRKWVPFRQFIVIVSLMFPTSKKCFSTHRSFHCKSLSISYKNITIGNIICNLFNTCLKIHIICCTGNFAISCKSLVQFKYVERKWLRLWGY